MPVRSRAEGTSRGDIDELVRPGRPPGSQRIRRRCRSDRGARWVLFGYDTGVISGALLLIKGDLGASTFEQSAIVGSLLLGAMAGALLSGYLAGAIGRRPTKIIS